MLSDYKALSESESNGIIGVDGSKIEVFGYGYLALCLTSNEISKEVLILTYHCNKINGTFISEYELTSAGIDYRSMRGVPYLFWDDYNCVEVKRVDRFILIPKEFVMKPNELQVCSLHSALGHIDKRKAIKSVEGGFVSTSEEYGPEDESSSSCIACKLGKAKRKDHVKGSRDKYLISSPFYRVCSDLMHVNEYGANRMYRGHSSVYTETSYVLTIICEYSNFCLAFVLRKKSDAFPYIKRANEWFKRMFDSPIVHFHTDKGTEYVNKQCQDYFSEEGITHTTTSGYASMENGKAERRNRTLRDDIRTNLASSGLDQKYWAQAMDYSVALRNKAASDGVSPETKILDYVFTANQCKEIMKHVFRPFGSLGIYYDVASKRPDNELKSHVCFYLGPAFKPCTNYPTVLDGDLVVVMKRESDGSISEEVIQTTNVTYIVPTKVYKDCDLVALGIDHREPVAPAVIDRDQGGVSEEPRHVPQMQDMMFINFAPAKNGDTIEKISDLEERDISEKLPNRDEANQDTTGLTNETVELIEENADDASDHTTNETRNTEVSIEDAEDGPLLEKEQEENATNTNTNSFHGEYVHTLEEGDFHDLLDVSNATMLNEELDKDTQQTGPHEGNAETTFPDDRRITRSMYRLNQVSAVRMMDLQRLPGEKPAPQRLIYDIVKLDKEEGQGWKLAYDTECESHRLNGSWDETPIRTSDSEILKKTVQMQVICTEKRELNGVKPKKVRVVLRGDKQHPSTYSDTFSPTLGYDSFRMIIADAVQSNRHIIMIDIKTAYLNAPIDTEIYVELPKSMESKPTDLSPKERVVHRLKKAVYGLRQSGRQWFETLKDWLLSIGFELRGDIPCVLIKTDKVTKEVLLVVAFFVDDMIIAGKTKDIAEAFVEQLKTEYELKQTKVDQNGFRDILGIKLREKRDKRSGDLVHIDLSLSSYIKTLINDMGLTKEFKNSRKLKTPLEPGFQFNPVTATPHQMTGGELAHAITWCREEVGALQYIAAALRPDLAYAANYMSRFVTTPHPIIINQLKRILRYTYHTRGYMIRYSKCVSDKGTAISRLITYSDADHAGDLPTRKSTLAAIFMMNGGPITWYARVARYAATSSTDAEVAAMVEAGNNLAYYREFLVFLRIIGPEYSHKNEMTKRETTKEGGAKANLKPLVMYVDNTSAITLANKGTIGSRTKHMGVRVARANDIRTNEHIIFVYLSTKDMLADILTKAVSTEVMNKLIPKIMEISESDVHH